MEEAFGTPLSASPYLRLPPGPGLSPNAVAAHQTARLLGAVIELLAAEGYGALTVRGVSRRARISTGTFYRHCRGTDECFLAAFEQSCRRAAERFGAAANDQQDRRHKVRAGIDRLLRDILADRVTAEFLLRAAPAAGPPFVPRLQAAAMPLGEELARCLATDGQSPPPGFLLEGVVGGLARIGRLWLSAGEPGDLDRVVSEATGWALALAWDPSAEPAPALEPPEGQLDPPGQDLPAAPFRPDAEDAERAVILAAVLRVAEGGCHQLSASSIRREAGVSRQAFDRRFDTPEQCFLEALEERAMRAIADATRPSGGPADCAAAVTEALATIFGTLGERTDTRRMLLVDILAAGRMGIDCRDRIIVAAGRALRASAQTYGHAISALAAEASVAAAWTLLARRVREEQVGGPAADLSGVALLLLAPLLGGGAAPELLLADKRQPF